MPSWLIAAMMTNVISSQYTRLETKDSRILSTSCFCMTLRTPLLIMRAITRLDAEFDTQRLCLRGEPGPIDAGQLLDVEIFHDFPLGLGKALIIGCLLFRPSTQGQPVTG